MSCPNSLQVTVSWLVCAAYTGYVFLAFMSNTNAKYLQP